MGKPIPKALEYDEVTGVWKRLNKDAVAKARGYAGEQSMGFWFGERGYFIVEGPSGPGGHNTSAKGLDGVAYHPGKKELVIYDNKALREAGAVSKASAITENLEENLKKLIKKVEGIAGREGVDAMPHAEAILRDLKQALRAVKSGKGWPKNVRLAVSGASGQATKVGRKLGTAGIVFIEYNELSKIRGAPWQRNPAMKTAVEQISKDTRKLEFEAAKKLSQAEERRIIQRVGNAVKSHAAAFVEKRMPKIITKFVMSASAKKAAKRAASLVPLAGWAFAGKDAYHGVEDILRGHTARGLAGIGLSIVDVGADFVHLGDAISGVGGTVASLGIQAGTIAGQVAIEVERLKEKMQQLNEEIAKNGTLPPDGRLREEFDLDDDDIKKLKDEFNKEDDEPEPALELPPPPAYEDIPPPLRLDEPFYPPASVPSPIPRTTPKSAPRQPTPTLQPVKPVWDPDFLCA
jgi:hypothetical protein